MRGKNCTIGRTLHLQQIRAASRLHLFETCETEQIQAQLLWKFLYEKVKQDRFLYGSEFVQTHFNVAQTKTFGHVNIFVRKCILLTSYGDKNKSL
jgi:hypothetical protein